MRFEIETVRRELPGRRISYFETLDSTMREAALLADAGSPSGTAVIADEQTAGLGRHGHTWHSEKGSGLYVSIILRPELPADSMPLLTLALGLATAEAIARTTDVRCDLRWPNDILVGEKKVAGILVQLLESAVIAGIGINVNHYAFPPEIAAEATSLRITAGRPHAREDLLISLAPAVDSFCKMLVEGGKEAILKAFSQHSSYARNKRVRVQQGDEIIRGERISLVQFGSRADVYLPANAKIQVKLGDHITGGETVLARIE